ncbi:MAG: radical SAM protein, partial [Patescibacteria group bacterium]
MNCSQPKRLVVLLIRPSKYHKDGYLLQWLRGYLPSNSLAVMCSLTEAAFADWRLANINSKKVLAFDEVVRNGRINPGRLMKQYASEGTTVVVGLVGVQTNMFPRAFDLAGEFLAFGAKVVIGGFHVSGSITMLHDDKHPVGSCPSPFPSDCPLMPTECAELMRQGVVIFHGEAEDQWPGVLADIFNGRPMQLYRGGRPDISRSPLPNYPLGYFKGFMARVLTLDSGRGCPFHCSFCSIINVQGNKVRFRSVEAIESWIRQACANHGRIFWFFTDDNFCRNPDWEDILLAAIKLRHEGLEFKFMVQSDLLAWVLAGRKTKRSYVELLGEAGCSQVFLGVESVHQDTLKETGKPQNRVTDYKEMVESYHAAGIACHASYIIGFPEDTPSRVAEDVRTLQEIGFDQASFFMLTPIPGSVDHARMLAAGEWMDPDFNRYDSCQSAMRHPIMTPGEWQKAYDDAWSAFYTKEQIAAALSRINPKSYWGTMANLFSYRWSALREGVHPMLGGFYRYRRWGAQRPGLEKESRLKFWLDEGRRHLRFIGGLIGEYFFFQDVYLQTRWMPAIREQTAKVADLH